MIKIFSAFVEHNQILISVETHLVSDSCFLDLIECYWTSMSIICTAVEDSPHLRKNLRRGLNGYVWATVDPAKRHQLPFPSDYKYFSCLLARKYALWADRIQNFKLRPDDIWVLGSLKTGEDWKIFRFEENIKIFILISFQERHGCET